jgi:DNA repair ATPase RecN
MENERVAKFFIGTLLEQNVVSLEINPQEYTYKRSAPEDDEPGAHERPIIVYSIFRVDFVATIRTETGEQRKILIEVQKAWNQDDLMRFRTYLGEHYKRIDKVSGKEVILPITTIYILDFKLPEIESACIKVEREYQDMINHRPITVKCAFVEKLTHDSYVVQARRITSERYQTKLDMLLSIFEQAHFVGNTEMVKMYNHETDDENVKEMTAILHHAGTDPEERKELEIEQEAIRTLTASFGKKIKALEEQEHVIKEQEHVIKEKDKALEEKDKENAVLKRQLEELQRQLHQK